MYAPVGKSGPLMIFLISVIDKSGLSIMAIVALMTSLMLWGGMFVAIPTAMPDDPLTRRFGMPAGRTFGSVRWSSKFGAKSTVFLSMSASSSVAIRMSRASVYDALV